MPAIGNILATTLASDGLMLTSSATVGYNTTLAPDGITPDGVARWVDRSGGIAIGYPWVSLSRRRPTKDSRNYKVGLKVGVPRLATTSPSTNTGIEPAPQKAYEHQFHADWILPERGTYAERLVLYNLVLSLFHATINASDGNPTDNTLSPLGDVVTNLSEVY